MERKRGEVVWWRSGILARLELQKKETKAVVNGQ